MAGFGDLYAAMEELMVVCRAALVGTPEGLPDECAIWIDSGPPSWDTVPSLVIHAGGPSIGDTFPLQPALAPGHRVAVTAEVVLMAITATVIRCAPTLGEDGERLPTPDEHQDAARQTSADLWAITNFVREAKRREMLWAPKTREFFEDGGVALNQMGGATGWQITWRTRIDGYLPDLSALEATLAAT